MTAATGSGRSVHRLDGSRSLSRDEVGGKAWSVNNMRALNLPVPAAVVIGTPQCRDFYANGGRLDETVWKDALAGLSWIERETGRTFGGPARPLLLSVRSGAAYSMPGMMDTVLDLGINTVTAQVLAAESGEPAYAEDTLARFRQLYAKVVLGDPAATGDVPRDPMEQLHQAIEAVFRSWRSPRAVAYREHHGLDHNLGTAVTIQAMVFGNLDDRSGSGVVFSRNPLDGSPAPYGEWLARAQGEDVVSGSHTPQPLSALADKLPAAHAALLDGVALLERDGRDLQDIEFTIESGTLWFLQSRAAKRAPRAATTVAVTLWREGILSADEALARVTAEQVRQLLKPTLHAAVRARATILATGEPACPGLASGVAVGSADEAEERADSGEQVVLVTATTSPDDVHGMLAAVAVVTELGGTTSHAAVVSREIVRPCVVGCGVGTATRLLGQTVTVDGASGEVLAGSLSLDANPERSDPDLQQLLQWADERAPVRVLVPADEPDGCVDLDAAGATWRSRLKGAAAVKGRTLDFDDGVADALAAGVKIFVAEQRLPILLAAIEQSSHP